MAESRVTTRPGESKDTPAADLSLHLSDGEREILQLYDQLEDLKLEIALLRAQGEEVDVAVVDQPVSEAHVETAERELLDAKASYLLRKNIVESILVAEPVLKAVHAGVNAMPVERDLLPLIRARDDVSVSVTESSKTLNGVLEELTRKEAEHVGVVMKNRELTGTLMGLVEELGAKEDVTDEKFRAQLEALEKNMAVSRQRWRIIKGTISGVVAGSGVDWARDEELRALVLDEEEE